MRHFREGFVGLFIEEARKELNHVASKAICILPKWDRVSDIKHHNHIKLLARLELKNITNLCPNTAWP